MSRFSRREVRSAGWRCDDSANASVLAGLSSSTGAIGSSVPVTIVATSSSEANGGPVTINFNFSLNVENFAANTGTGNFGYGVSYTYMGKTTSLVNNTYSLGGNGITRAGPGPMDSETGTLDAHIGDTFTLSFKESFVGRTVAPLQVGVKNVSWLIDTKLGISVKDGATYYVANSGSGGSDSNSGTSAGSPWLTLAHAQSVASDGDTILLDGDETFAETSTVTFTVGVTISSYGTGRPTISSSTTGISLIAFTNVDGWSVNNLIMSLPTYTSGAKVGCVAANFTDGTTRSRGITISNCTMTGGYACIAFNTGTGTTVTQTTGITISNNTLSNAAVYGVGFLIGDTSFPTPRSTMWYSNVLVENNTISNNAGYLGGNAATGILLVGANVTTGPCTIRDNTVSGMGAPGKSDGLGIWWGNCTGVVCQDNVCSNILLGAAGGDAAGFDCDQQSINSVVQYNVAYNCQGPGFVYYPGPASSTGNVCRFNLLVNCSTHPGNQTGVINITYDPGSNNAGGIEIYNNTAVSSTPGSSGLSVVQSPGGGIENITRYNNLFVVAAGAPAVNIPATATGFDLEGNAYLSGTSSFLCELNSTSYTSLAAWRTASGFETSPHGIALSSNPFVNGSASLTGTTPTNLAPALNYRPAAGAAIIDAALDLLSLYGINPGTQDLFGDPIPVPYAIGAAQPAPA